MDLSKPLSISSYVTISSLNEEHQIYLVKDIHTNQIYVKKILDVYNKEIYLYLKENPISNIPKIMDLLEINNQLILIEEYINGQSLQYFIDNHILNLKLIHNYSKQLAMILNTLHHIQPPIIHRDIKPSNILIKDDILYLIDFNAAKYYSDSNKDTIILGTPGYAAPEQYGFGASSTQTDIYAYGILLKNMCESIHQNTKCFDVIINNCIRLKANERYNNVQQIITELKRIDVKHPNLSIFNKYMLPGYRSRNLLHMIIATIVYISIIYICITALFEYKELGYKENTYFSIMFFIICMVIILYSCNYLNIQRFSPFYKCKNRNTQILGIIIMDIIIVFILSLIFLFFSMYTF